MNRNPSPKKNWLRSSKPQDNREASFSSLQFNARTGLKARVGFIVILFIILLSACGEQDARSTPDYFVPPTLSNPPAPITLATPTPIIPTPTTACTNDLTFLDDVTIPDGTAFIPGELIDKVWQVANAGTCNWDSDYRVRFIDGDSMGADLEQALFPARSASNADIAITFIAPDTPGIVTSAWQAYSPDGEPFGDIFFIQIVVDPDLTPTDTPAATE